MKNLPSHNIFLVLISGLFLMVFVQCSSEREGSSAGAVTVKLSTASRAKSRISSCTMTLDSGPLSGECLTPLKLVAKADDISAFSSSGGVGARLIQMSAAPSGLGLNGPFGVLGLATFDFSAPSATTNEYSEDNIQDLEDQNTIFNMISVGVGALELQIEIPSANAGVTNRFWTIRYPFIAQNPLQESTFSACPAETSIRTTIDEGGDLYSAPTEFRRQDILVCQKGTAAAVCEDSDYRFIDSSSGALSTTRPSSPVLLSGTFVSDAECEEGSEHPDMDFGESGLALDISNPFRIQKDNAGDGTFNYTFQTECNFHTGECTDAETTASLITIEVAIDMDDFVFVHSTVDLESDSEVNILKNLHKVLPKPLYGLNAATAEGETIQNGEASATVNISETTSR